MKLDGMLGLVTLSSLELALNSSYLRTREALCSHRSVHGRLVC